ncbi:MAG: hypothetical protein OIF47_04740 [Marinibacterium sp.]|nr:hypothetical protein [Marinibacterium sp.]
MAQNPENKKPIRPNTPNVSQTDKADRLKSALKANLARRKAQAKARQGKETDT